MIGLYTDIIALKTKIININLNAYYGRKEDLYEEH